MIKRLLPRLLLALVLLVGLAWIGDSVVAARVEAEISRKIRAQAELDVPPSVYVGGIPYTQALFSGEIQTIAVTISDVELPGFGIVTTSSVATDVTADTSQIFSGDISGAPAQLLTQTAGLDAVAMGAKLDMPELDISNAYDISPAGSNAAEVQLRGTVPGDDAPVTVIAELRLQGPTFSLQPITVHERAGSRLNNAEIIDAFRWSFDTRELMGSRQASYVYVSGGTIYFESQERNVVVDWEDFALNP